MQSRSQKSLWEKLARVNPLFYIASKFGKGITEEQFEETAEEDFKKHIHEDDLIKKDGDYIWLDLGCGIGRITKWMAYRCKKVYGIDISEEMIRLANLRKEKFVKQNIVYYETDGSTIPYPENFFDFVFSYLVFQHMKSWFMIKDNFDGVYKALKPGGIFKVLLRKKEEPLKWWNGGFAVTKQIYEAVCQLVGFKIIKSTYDSENYTYWLWLTK